jgi:hypothetical protein
MIILNRTFICTITISWKIQLWILTPSFRLLDLNLWSLLVLTKGQTIQQSSSVKPIGIVYFIKFWGWKDYNSKTDVNYLVKNLWELRNDYNFLKKNKRNLHNFTSIHSTQLKEIKDNTILKLPSWQGLRKGQTWIKPSKTNKSTTIN